mmetsp:Transcript_3450/g.6105  ORF Transcript_3450/g.6105 Transcript_3450/m.6105 type:complete len:251 (+) Transcript_3450:369-1121(+)
MLSCGRRIFQRRECFGHQSIRIRCGAILGGAVRRGGFVRICSIGRSGFRALRLIGNRGSLFGLVLSWFGLSWFGLHLWLAMGIRPEGNALGGETHAFSLCAKVEGWHARKPLHRRHGGETLAGKTVLLRETTRLVQRFAGDHGDLHAVFLQHLPVVFQLGHGIGREPFQPFFDPVSSEVCIRCRCGQGGVEYLIVRQHHEGLEIVALPLHGEVAQARKGGAQIRHVQCRLSDHRPVARRLSVGEGDAVGR